MKRLHPPGCTLLPSQDADVLLLDDCLAAVDAKVAAWILRHALLGPLLWAPPAGAATAKQQQQQPPAQHQQESRQRTVIVATHSPELLAAADLVVEMQGGAVAALRQQPGAAQRRAQAAAETAAAATAEGGEGAPPSIAILETPSPARSKLRATSPRWGEGKGAVAGGNFSIIASSRGSRGPPLCWCKRKYPRQWPWPCGQSPRGRGGGRAARGPRRGRNCGQSRCP